MRGQESLLEKNGGTELPSVIGRLDSGDSKLANTWPNEAADGCTCFLSSRVAPGLIHASVCVCVYAEESSVKISSTQLIHCWLRPLTVSRRHRGCAVEVQSARLLPPSEMGK